MSKKRKKKRIEIPGISPDKNRQWYAIKVKPDIYGTYYDIYNQDNLIMARLHANGEISIIYRMSYEGSLQKEFVGFLRNESNVNFKGRLFQAARYVFLKTQRPIS